MAAVGAGMVFNEHRDHVTLASIASNGAATAHLGAFYFNRDVRVKSAVYVPNTNAATSTNATVSYRQLSLVNAGTGGAGTTVVGSLNITASIASMRGRAWTVSTTSTIASGEVLVVSVNTVGGGNDNDATELKAGTISIVYETI